MLQIRLYRIKYKLELKTLNELLNEITTQNLVKNKSIIRYYALFIVNSW